MPANVTVSHLSPSLSYIPRSAWFEGPHLEDNSTYHATNNTQSGNASVSFSWFGTGAVYGGYRKWLGDYKVIFDGEETTHHKGYTEGPEDTNYLLFNMTGVHTGPHTIRIVNTSNDPNRPILDIHSIVFQSQLFEAHTIEHTDPGCTWRGGLWTADDTSHSTNDSFGAMELKFRVRSGIALYGPITASSAPLSVSIDGRRSHLLSPNTASASRSDEPQVLFTAMDLNEGDHTMRVENNPTDTEADASWIRFSYGRVFSVHEPEIQGGRLQPTDSPVPYVYRSFAFYRPHV
ncbi:hypothetical protein C8Q76DRAFT_609802 [Earliella scabrosa]|nr:hypothetical protein C8Q76DRAFT_609802 [Earliella scabrosa]